jgi:light-regulated signal transduction histidine kinase (bacteriophytochrome)
MQRLDHLGEVDRLMLVVEEVTAEIRATRALREANATLEERVRERTAQLIAVNRELDAFTYSVAHDLRAPLRAIHGFAQALVEDYGSVLPEGAQRYLQRIQANADRMASLIDDLLSLARVGHAQVQRRPLDLSALADEIMHRLLEAEPGRSVQWRVEPGLVAQADEGLLRVVLENLLSNALKFSSRRDIAEIVFGVTDHQGQRAFYVRDNGAGFDMAYADRLFEPFQRLHRDDEFPGTGIGLPTVRRAVARHGGHVWAEGSPDAGATVYFTLPEGGADLLARPGGESDLPGGVPAQ